MTMTDAKVRKKVREKANQLLGPVPPQPSLRSRQAVGKKTSGLTWAPLQTPDGLVFLQGLQIETIRKRNKLLIGLA